MTRIERDVQTRVSAVDSWQKGNDAIRHDLLAFKNEQRSINSNHVDVETMRDHLAVGTRRRRRRRHVPFPFLSGRGHKSTDVERCVCFLLLSCCLVPTRSSPLLCHRKYAFRRRRKEPKKRKAKHKKRRTRRGET